MVYIYIYVCVCVCICMSKDHLQYVLTVCIHIFLSFYMCNTLLFKEKASVFIYHTLALYFCFSHITH